MIERPFKKTVCLDFDGVVHLHDSPWLSADRIPDGPVPGAMQAIRAYVETFRVTIYSGRTGQPGGVHAMQHWLKMHLVAELGADEGDRVFHLIEWPHSKPLSFVGLDDRQLTFDGAWPSVEALAAFQPWNKRDPVDETDAAHHVADAVHDCLIGGESFYPGNFDPAPLKAAMAKRGYRIVRL